MRKIVPLLLASLLVTACSGGSGSPDGGGLDADGGAGLDGGGSDGDAGPGDGGDHDGGGSDGGGDPVSCGDPDARACLSNPDCGVGEICGTDSVAPADRCCVPGSPGTGAVGEPCDLHEDCAFGRCIARDDGQAFCSGECLLDLDCPNRMDCSDIFHWCWPVDTTVPPRDCGEVSLNPCFFNDNCPTTFRCEDVGGPQAELLCCSSGPRGTRAVGEVCVDHVECDFGRCLGGLCSEACDFDVDPCPTATMICNTIRGLCEPL